MNLDVPLKAAEEEKACTLLMAGGFNVSTKQLSTMTPREVAWKLSDRSPRRRKTVLALIELAVDDEAA
jgi:hypothetical protein